MHRRQHRTPAFRNTNNCAIGGKRGDQALQNALHARDQVSGQEQAHGINVEFRKRQRVLLHRITLVFEKHHDHRDAEQHLWHRPKQIAAEPRLKLAEHHQHSPEQ